MTDQDFQDKVLDILTKIKCDVAQLRTESFGQAKELAVHDLALFGKDGCGGLVSKVSSNAWNQNLWNRGLGEMGD